MSLAECFGCFLIAVGPVLILFFMTVSHDPMLIILTIASAFFWMLSLLLSSAWWLFFDMIVFPYKSVVGFGLVFAVIFQELFRFILFKSIMKAENGLRTVWRSGDFFLNENQISYVAGLGVGSIHCIFHMVNLLAAMFGPGTAGLKGHSYDFFITSSFLSLGFFLLNIFWGVVFFHGFRYKLYHQPLIVFISHMIVSSSTMLNTRFGVKYSLMGTLAMTIIMASYTYKILGGTWQSLKNSFKFIDTYPYPSSSSSSEEQQQQQQQRQDSEPEQRQRRESQPE